MPEPEMGARASTTEGAQFVFEREITATDVQAFATLSGDSNRLHIDSAYASSTNFGAPIVHGAFQVGLASAMLGVHLPGGNVLLGAVNARFPAPLYYPSNVSVAGTIRSWDAAAMSGRLEVVITETAKQTETARIFMTFGLHENRRASGAAEARVSAKAGDIPSRRTVLVTGASGALGSAICESLMDRFDIMAITHSRALQPPLASAKSLVQIQIDLASDHIEDALGDAIGTRELFGVIHAAWPGAPAGGLLEAPKSVVNQQLQAGTTVPLALARQLFRNVGAGGGRFIAIGSVAGSHKPHLPKGAYSLGKNALEQTVRLIAPELARREITANVISPGFIAAGINSRSTERQQLLEAASIPFGRLCTVSDVADTVSFLMSDAASYVSAQNIVLAGAQL
jgi:3-oxoacyl-[acyl-carrier protein] reductase